MSASPTPELPPDERDGLDPSAEYRIRGVANPKDPLERALQRAVNAVRRGDLDDAVSLATRVRRRAFEASRFEVAARASSYLGEVAGIRGDLDLAFREYSQALGHFDQTALAASTSRALRGFAQAYYMTDFPTLAIDYAQRARHYLSLIDRREPRRRCEFECAVWEGLPMIALGRLDVAAGCVATARSLEREMGAIDPWLMGLSLLLRGRFEVASASTSVDASAGPVGLALLREAAEHCESSGLIYWEAVCRDALARAFGSATRWSDEGRGEMERALATFERLGAQIAIGRSRDWLRARARRDRPSARRLGDDEISIEGACVSGPKMRAAINNALIVADDDVPVLVVGETGTGKTAIARIIHSNSPRAQKPLVTVMCSHLTREMAQAELFGHARGAFTSAIARRPGKFREAEGGTIFLDEIHTLDADVQAMILRAIETGVI